MRKSVPLFSAEKPTPRQVDTIKGILDNLGYAVHSFKNEKEVLVFGTQAPPNLDHDTKVVYTYTLKQLCSMPDAVTALHYATKELFGEAPTVKKRQHIRCALYTLKADRYCHVSVALTKLDPAKPIALDIETDGNLGVTHTPEDVNIITMSFAQDDLCVSVSAYSDSNIPFSRADNTSETELLRDFLDSLQYIVAHNGKFDLRVINRLFDLDLVTSFDTMIAHHVLNQAARGRHGLKTTASRYLGAPDWEADIQRYVSSGGHYEKIPQYVLTTYNMWDVHWTLELFEFFRHKIDADPEAQTAFALEMMMQGFLQDVEVIGIPISAEGKKAVETTAEQRKIAALRELREMAGENFNPASHQQVRNHLIALGYKVTSTNEETLEVMIKDHPKDLALVDFCKILLMYRGNAKILSTYVKGWEKYARNGRVHPTFNVHGTSTGRLSSSGPNVQNMPRDTLVRKMVGG